MTDKLHQIENRRVVTASRPCAPSKEVMAQYAAKCLSCGACCSYYAYTELCLPVEDGPLMGDDKYTIYNHQDLMVRKVDTNEPPEPYSVDYWLRTKQEDGWKKCIALEGHVGVSVSCSVYDKRPSVCSNFEPGSPACIKTRRWAKLEI